jgi:hypothetical protein
VTCFDLICVDCAPAEGRIRILSPQAMSVREAGVKLKSIRDGNTRFGEHHTPQSPACMAGTGRVFICGSSITRIGENHRLLRAINPACLCRVFFCAENACLSPEFRLE